MGREPIYKMDVDVPVALSWNIFSHRPIDPNKADGSNQIKWVIAVAIQRRFTVVLLLQFVRETENNGEEQTA